MRSFSCPTCGQNLYFENSLCIRCGSAVGYSRVERQMLVVGEELTPCANLDLNGCNWIPEVAGGECFACQLTRTRPSDDDARGLPLYYDAEQAKRRLVYELDVLGLPIAPRDEESETGLTFDLLSSSGGENVITGHENGVITIDLAESDDAHRERVRLDMGEAYRTMLGHFRHEVGHYYEWVLVEGTPWQTRLRLIFGDDTASYQDAIDRHYAEGPPAGWEDRYVSAYATMHPYEDFAETFAHVLHIRDTLETAHAFSLIPDPNVAARNFTDVVVGTWLPLTYGFNQINRSMGAKDLYPFLLAPAVIDKLALVDELLVESSVHSLV